jgi:hypothetical protein
LDPTVRKGGWTRDEDEGILGWQRILGNKWAKIADYLPGR